MISLAANLLAFVEAVWMHQELVCRPQLHTLQLAALLVGAGGRDAAHEQHPRTRLAGQCSYAVVLIRVVSY